MLALWTLTAEMTCTGIALNRNADVSDTLEPQGYGDDQKG